jgi:hypothetical protein
MRFPSLFAAVPLERRSLRISILQVVAAGLREKMRPWRRVSYPWQPQSFATTVAQAHRDPNSPSAARFAITSSRNSSPFPGDHWCPLRFTNIADVASDVIALYFATSALRSFRSRRSGAKVSDREEFARATP